MLAKSFRIYMSTIIFVMTFIVYSSNGFGYFASWDTAPNSLLVFNLLENHRLDFDNFKGTFPKEAAYMFTTNVDGHLQSVFPIGSAVLSAPIYVGIDLAVHAKHGSLPLASPAFEHERRIFEKVAATVIASLASVIFFLCVIELSTGIVAIILTLTFAFATSMWAIGAQAMWQHGSVNLMFLTMTLLLLQQQRYQGKRRVAVIALAGLAAGMLISIRPTASVFSFAALAWVFYTDKRNIVFFVLAAIAGIMPAAIWNIVNFHNLVGWYSSIAGRYHTSFFDALEAGAGLAISPSKGLLIYLPLTIFSLVGAIITVRSQRASERLLSFYCVAGLAVYCSYSLFQGWWGGYCFGPRYLTDLDALIVLLLVPFVHQMQLLYSQRHRKLEVTIVVAVASLFMIYSVGVQAVGAYGEPQGEWSSIPMSVDTHPDRVWDASDSQILRDAHAAYHRVAVNPTMNPAYLAMFRADVVGLQSSCIKHNSDRIQMHVGEECDIIVRIHNDGAVPLFGYASGIVSGQALVRLQTTNLKTMTSVPDQYLYLKNIDQPGSDDIAEGTLTSPEHKGLFMANLSVMTRTFAPLPHLTGTGSYKLYISVY